MSNIIHADPLERWARNGDRENLGIVQFSHELLPERINDTYGVPEMHKNIYMDLLEARTRKGATKMDRLHAIAAPREHSKSTITSFVYVLYSILFRLAKFVVLISESQPKTLQFIRAIKRALAKPIIQEYFGDVRAENVALDGLKWSESHIITATGVNIMALGMGRSTRGLIEDTRPDIIIADDIESENNTKTEDSRENNYAWWKAQVVPAGDIIDGQCVYIGTMVHYDCTLARLLEQKSYRKHFYQVWLDAARTKTLWPEKFPPKLVRQIEAEYREDEHRGESLFYMEYMNVAVAPSDRVFGDSGIQVREYEYISNSMGKWVRSEKGTLSVETFIGIDPAISASSKAAYTAIITIAVDTNGHVYVLDLEMERFDIRNDPDTGRRGTVEVACEKARIFQPQRLVCALTGLGEPIGNEIRRELQRMAEEEPEMNYVTYVGIKETPDLRKDDRIKAVLSSPFKRGKVWMQKDHHRLAEELRQFPKSRTFDAMDALCNAVIYSHPPYQSIEYNKGVEKELPPGFLSLRGERPVKRDWEVM
jgi:hypothetical protein